MRRILAMILVLSLMGTVLYFSSQNGGDSNDLSRKVAKWIVSTMELKADTSQSLVTVNLIVRKLAHFSEYLLMGVLLAVAFANLLGKTWLAVPLAGFVGVAFAFCDEWVQSGSPGRTQSILDVMVDSAGVCVGLVAFSIVMIGVRRSADGSRRRN